MSLLIRNRERWYRWVVARKNGQATPGFFDRYPRFLSSSTTAATKERLNQRYRALIEWNHHLIEGKRVLDLASHDGRWSFAARQAGASYVRGIEARSHLVEAARANVREYDITDVDFIEGDIFQELDWLKGEIDTVLCFGFFYHTLNHMSLLHKIAKLKPSHLIMDTAVSLKSGSIIEVEPEIPEEESCGAFERLKGTPTKQALELMLTTAGFYHLEYYDWHHAGITDWRELKAYYLRKRVSLRATV